MDFDAWWREWYGYDETRGMPTQKDAYEGGYGAGVEAERDRLAGVIRELRAELLSLTEPTAGVVRRMEWDRLTESMVSG